MSLRLSLNAVLLSCFLIFSVIPISSALKFDIQSHPQGSHHKSARCIRNFVSKNTLVVVTAIISGQRGDGQTVNMHVSQYLKPLSLQSCSMMM